MLKLSSGGSAARLAGTCVVLSAVASATSARAQEKSADNKWYDPIVLDLGGGVPAASSQELRFIGDGTAGYVLRNFGIVARGSTFYYELNTDSASTDTTHNEGSVEGWFSSGEPADALRLQIRASGGGAWYDTTFVPHVASAGLYHDEDSMLGRGNLLLGAEFRAKTVDGYVLAGGGYQWESYDYLAVDPHDPNLWSSTTDSSVRGLGRLQVRWSFLPGTLSTRLRSEGSYFSLTRENTFLRNASGGNAVGTAVSKVHQLEFKGRLSVEADTLAFAGIVPFVFGGLDYIGVSSDAGSSSVTVPSIGAGLFKPVGD